VENIPKDLQNVALPPDELDRAVAMAKPTNQKVRKAADARLRFEDDEREPETRETIAHRQAGLSCPDYDDLNAL